MSSSKYLTIQKAAKNVFQSTCFKKRWCRSDSLAKAISSRYKLDNIVLDARSISIAISKMEPSINFPKDIHMSGIYRGYKSNRAYYFYQSTALPPPVLPFYNDKAEWAKIEMKDSEMLNEYLESIDTFNSRVLER